MRLLQLLLRQIKANRQGDVMSAAVFWRQSARSVLCVQKWEDYLKNVACDATGTGIVFVKI